MKFGEIQNGEGKTWFDCPDCEHRNDVAPETRISDLVEDPRKCCHCKVDIAWHQEGQDRGMVSFQEMAESKTTRAVLPFPKKRRKNLRAHEA